jgi:hypothetical protein
MPRRSVRFIWEGLTNRSGSGWQGEKIFSAWDLNDIFGAAALSVDVERVLAGFGDAVVRF